MIGKKAKDGIKELVKAYDLLVKRIDADAQDSDDRTYGGIIRAGKGLLVESMAKKVIELSWQDLGMKMDRLSMNRQSVRIPLNKKYLERIKSPEVKEYIEKNIREYYYSLKTDIHVFIDDKFTLAIECKSYTENAMMKRILVDFTLLKSVYPDLEFILFQLESQLGGDYSSSNKIKFGSHSTHTLISYFDIDIIIVTLLEGERKIDEPIHKVEHYKELKSEKIIEALALFKSLLRGGR